MKIKCPCENLLRDQANYLPYKAHVISIYGIRLISMYIAIIKIETQHILKKESRGHLIMGLFQTLGFIKAFLNCYIKVAKEKEKGLVLTIF